WAAGEPLGLTPYGTETMHVLRAEKGYPIIGQDTDGTVTPQDLGMSWVVSKKKLDYLGRRSHQRADNVRADRKHLVGLLPQSPTLLLPEGAQLIETAEIPPPPVPMLGHVTSSYRSAALGRTFALALLQGGRDRISSTVHVVVDGTPVPATVTPPVLFDPDGTRRDGDPAGDGEQVEPVTAAGGAPVPPLVSYAARLLELSSRPRTLVRIAEEPASAKVNLRIHPSQNPHVTPAAAAVERDLGLLLPGHTSSTAAASGVEVLALGPDEFLVCARDASGAELEARLRAALGEDATGVCDVSATRTVLTVAGPAARTVLSHGCGLDVHAMATGTCAQSVLAQCAVILVADGPGSGQADDTMRVFVRSSFAAHLAEWLLLTAGEYAGPG
ncbi:MAG TPA: glycine cleavage T C-terminal barrel domain-containing protein, partial [Propionibacteriaceae bacterium]